MKREIAFAAFGLGLEGITAINAASLKPLDPAPGFSLPVYQGKTVSLSDFSASKTWFWSFIGDGLVIGDHTANASLAI